MMASWQQLLNTLMDEGDDEKNVKADIYQLRGLIEMMDTEAFEPIREGELGQAVPRRLQGLRRLIDTVVDSYGVQQGWISTEGYRATPTVDGYVR